VLADSSRSESGPAPKEAHQQNYSITSFAAAQPVSLVIVTVLTLSTAGSMV
jgi:hypothetical protein